MDVIVVVQAIAAGMILFRAAHEQNNWDRFGFVWLASASGLMTIRRVTASLDRYTLADRVVLPQIITWFMVLAATCFVLELIRRSVVSGGKPNQQVQAVSVRARSIAPFLLVFLIAAVDFIPAKTWDGEHVSDLTAEQAISEALEGNNRQAACEAVRRFTAKGIDTLRLIADGQGPDAEAARIKLQSLVKRVGATK